MAVGIIVSTITFFIVSQADMRELFWYFRASVVGSLISFPIPLIIYLLDLRNSTMETTDRYDKVIKHHFLITLIVMIIEATVAAALTNENTSWGNFAPVFFGMVIVYYCFYGLFSFIVWRIVNRDLRS